MLLGLSVLSSTLTSVPSVAAGPHFRIECHFDHPACARQALDVAEAVWPIAVALYPDETGAQHAGPTRTPLVVHLFRDEAAYGMAENLLTGRLYRRSQAFAHRTSRTAHVAVKPAVGNHALEQLGLPEQTLRLIAHEAAHLARFERMPNNALHPGWFLDGNAGFVDQEVMEAIGRSPGLERDPWTSQEIVSLQRMLETNRLPTASARCFGTPCRRCRSTSAMPCGLSFSGTCETKGTARRS
ncbi:MAG: hypothetical protein ACI8Y8_004412 [Planctomycetota bacterium]|jgi:hypothetical protein